MLSKETSLKISLLSFVAAVLVVCIHTPLTTVWGMVQLFENFVGTHLAAVAVPFFFIVSGFFVGRHTDEPGWYVGALRKRVKTLLIPYLIWCAILCITSNVNSFLANVIHHQPLMRNIDLSPPYMFGFNPNVNPPQPLWYLRALIFFVVISPMFVSIARRKFAFVIVALGLFTLGCFHGRIMAIFSGELFMFTLAPLNVLCFLIGVFFGRNAHLIEISSKLGGGLVLIAAILLTLFNTICRYVPFELGSVFSNLLRQVAILLTILGAWLICPAIELPILLRSQSFPVYLLHCVFLSAILVLKTLMPKFVECAAGYVFSLAFMVVCSIAASYVLRRFLPRFSNVVFGGR